MLGHAEGVTGLEQAALALRPYSDRLDELGFELPPSFPGSLMVIGLGVLAVVFVLIRAITVPDSVLPADGRGIGIWISLIAALGVVGGGLLRATEEL